MAEGWSLASTGASAYYYSASQTKGFAVDNSSYTKISNVTTSVNQSEYFKITGLSNVGNVAELMGYFKVPDRIDSGNLNVSLTSDGFSAILNDLSGGASRTITLTDNTSDKVSYLLALDEKINSSGGSATVQGFTENDGVYNYSTSGHTAYSDTVSVASQNDDGAATTSLKMYSALDTKTFSITGLSSGQSAALEVTDNTATTGGFSVTLGLNALTNKNVSASGNYGDSVAFLAGESVSEPTSTSGITGTFASNTWSITSDAVKAGYTGFGSNSLTYHE